MKCKYWMPIKKWCCKGLRCNGDQCEFYKPKLRAKTFKAWAHMWDDDIHCVQLRKQDFANLSLEPNAVVLPCVITIASKHLKK